MRDFGSRGKVSAKCVANESTVSLRIQTGRGRGIEIVANLLQVFPGLALLRRIAQKVGGMKSWHDFDAAKVLKLSAHAGDAFAYFKEIAQRGVSHHHDHIRLHGGDLAKQKRPADRSFFESRLPIAGRPAAIDVSDQNVFAFETNGFDDLRQQLAGATNERFALRILVGAGRFADEHQTRFVISMSIDDLRASFAQAAALAVAKVAPNVCQTLFGLELRQRGFRLSEVAEQRILLVGIARDDRCRLNIFYGLRGWLERPSFRLHLAHSKSSFRGYRGFHSLDPKLAKVTRVLARFAQQFEQFIRGRIDTHVRYDLATFPGSRPDGGGCAAHLYNFIKNSMGCRELGHQWQLDGFRLVANQNNDRVVLGVETRIFA